MERDKTQLNIDKSTVTLLEHPIVSESEDGSVREYVHIVAKAQDPADPDQIIDEYPLVKVYAAKGQTVEDGKPVTLVGAEVLGQLVTSEGVDMDRTRPDKKVYDRRRSLVNLGKRILEERGLNVRKAPNQRK